MEDFTCKTCLKAVDFWGCSFNAHRLRDAISKQELCMRTVGCNRHGHTADLRFPGPMGWNNAYAMARLSNLSKTGRGLAFAGQFIAPMKRYTEFGTEVSYPRPSPRGCSTIEQCPFKVWGGCGRDWQISETSRSGPV